MWEFKTFAIKGNMVNLAVDVIIGSVLAKIINSVVTDLLMPVIGSVVSNSDFSNIYIFARDTSRGHGHDTGRPD
jgi:large conductance mechanosensitive channel